MHDTLEPALDLFDGVVEEPDLSELVRDSRPTVSTESRQIAEQTAARLATAGGSRPRRGNWTGFVRYAAVFVCGALVVLVLGTAQQRFAPDPVLEPPLSRCLFWGESQEGRRGMTAEAAMARCGECHRDHAVVPSRGSLGVEQNDRGTPWIDVSDVGRKGRRASAVLALISAHRVARSLRLAEAVTLRRPAHSMRLAAPRRATRCPVCGVAAVQCRGVGGTGKVTASITGGDQARGNRSGCGAWGGPLAPRSPQRAVTSWNLVSLFSNV
jgi:hypothetical protein